MRLERFMMVPCLLILLAVAPALAEEVIYFTNGTSMPVRSHEVRGEMIHVDLGGDAFMAFPMYMVEKIEDAGKEVSLTPSFSSGSNVMAPRKPTPEGSYPVKGNVPSQYSKSQNKAPRLINKSEMVDEDGKMGTAVQRPLKGHRGANRRGLGVVGRSSRAQQSTGEGDGGYYGTSKQGTRHVIGGEGKSPNAREKTAAPVSLSRSAPSGKKKTGGSGN
jgi:hypothetical protein